MFKRVFSLTLIFIALLVVFIRLSPKPPVPPHAITRIQHTTATGGPDENVSTSNITVAAPGLNHLEILMSVTDAGTGGVPTLSSVTQTNVTWNQVSSNSAGVNAILEIWYAVNGSGSPGTTVTINANHTYTGHALLFAEYSGENTVSPLDQHEENGLESGTTITAGPTPTTLFANELLFAGVWDFNATASQSLSGPGNSFAFIDGSGTSVAFQSHAGRFFSCADVERFVTATGAYSATVTSASSDSNTGSIATFKDATQPGSSNGLLLQGVGQ